MAGVVLRGGGDLATGVALRLHRAGLRVVITELGRPLAVRRAVCFSEAVYERSWTVEGVTAVRADSLQQALQAADRGEIPVLVAPSLAPLAARPLEVLVDARLTKRAPETDSSVASLVIGLGPGFVAGIHCHAVVETLRGHTMGRVYWSGSAVPDTGIPDGDPRRVCRAPNDGTLVGRVEIGDRVAAGQVIAEIGGVAVASPFGGVVRGLIRPGMVVSRGMKIGDVDPRGVRGDCFLVSDKALAVGGGVLEAILSREDLRRRAWD